MEKTLQERMKESLAELSDLMNIKPEDGIDFESKEFKEKKKVIFARNKAIRDEMKTETKRLKSQKK